MTLYRHTYSDVSTDDLYAFRRVALVLLHRAMTERELDVYGTAVRDVETELGFRCQPGRRPERPRRTRAFA